MTKSISYEDKQYKQSENLYDTLQQCIEDLKYGTVSSANSWNMDAEKLKGISFKFIGEDLISIVYHRYEITTIEGLTRMEDDGYKFIATVVSELKKMFKKYTGKVLKTKEVKKDSSVEKVSRMEAETSWIYGASRYGYGNRPVGKFLIRESIVYSFSSAL